MNRIKSLAALGAAALVSCFAVTAQAQPWPAKPIHWIVGFAPGGGTDIVGRALGQKVSELLADFLRHDPADDVGAAAGREHDHHAHRFGWILLGPCRAGGEQGKGRHGSQ
jgi:tripartite-type tricarboxylate transporter receptor subunit TctC